MFNILATGSTLLDTTGPIQQGLRLMFMSFDYGIYWLLRFNFELFFNIATFNILDREMVFNIFSRIQLIVGIFMMFQLVMIVIKGIVNPDTVSDTKTGGAGNMVMRIVISLALLALIVPINISSPRNEYEKQINNNGILFGTLYSLQYRILSNNTIGKLILGGDEMDYTSLNPNSQALSKFADRFTTTIVKTFYTLNMGSDGTSYVCNDGFDTTYNKETSPFMIISYGLRQCNLIGPKYSITMSYLVGTLAGGVLVVVMLMMCFEVAKRVFQLAALQLMAPIPIISYMDPKGSKDGAFNAWLKLLITTYLELFIRLAVIYFALGVIKAFSDKYMHFTAYGDAVVETAKNDALVLAPHLVGYTFVIMCIALFIFAKDAPKFFKQMLGIKDDGKGFFSSFGTAMGLGVAAVGTIGSFNNSRQASWKRDRNNAMANGMDEQSAIAYANRNRGKHLLSGLLGAGVGVAQGSAAASESKGNGLAKTLAAINAQSKHNRKVSDAADNGAGLLDALFATGQKVVRGQSDYELDNSALKIAEQRNKAVAVQLKNRSDALKVEQTANDLRDAVDKRLTAKAKDKDGIMGTYGTAIAVNWKKYHSSHENAKAGGGVHWVFEPTAQGRAAGFNDNLTKQQYERLTADQQQLFTDQSYFEVESELIDPTTNRPFIRNILMRDAEAISGGLLKENSRDLYEETVAFEQGRPSRAHDDDVLAKRRIFRQETGQDMEATYEGNGVGVRDVQAREKERLDIEAADISRGQREVSAEEQRISQAKQSAQYRRRESADNYIGGGKNGS